MFLFLSNHLQYVVSWWNVGDVDPLTVNVCVICVVASRTETLMETQTEIRIFLYIKKKSLITCWYHRRPLWGAVRIYCRKIWI